MKQEFHSRQHEASASSWSHNAAKTAKAERLEGAKENSDFFP